MQYRTILTTIFITILLHSCSTSRVGVSNVVPVNEATREYIEKYAPIAISEMRRTGVPASIKLAQGMIESDYGRSRLAKIGNNHFGVKCHTGWKGPVVIHDDDARGECFRKYSDAEQSFRDHSDFLTTGSRYRSLFNLATTDYKGWARGLKNAGYATNPAYAEMLIRKIEENNLDAFDRGYTYVDVRPRTDTDTEFSRPDIIRPTDVKNLNGSRYSSSVAVRVKSMNRVDYIVVNETDTEESILRDFDLLSWELQKYNEKYSPAMITPGGIIYLQPKRKKAEPGVRYHIVRQGESMYDISQLYAIRLQELLEMNFMESGSEPETGRTLNLR
jgi:LysM repeat protein